MQTEHLRKATLACLALFIFAFLVSVKSKGAGDPEKAVPVGLVGHWDFNEGSGDTVHDRAGYFGDLKTNGGPKWIKNKSGYCMFIDNEEGKGPVFLSYPNFAPLYQYTTGGYMVGSKNTVAMWIKLDDGGYAKAKRNFGCLFYIKFIIYERDITFVVGGDPRMQLTFRLAAPKPENGEWVHIAGTQDGIFARFYINGELMKQSIGEVVTNGHLLPFGQVKSPWRFGLTYPWGKSGRYRGYVDDVRLYSKALSPEELKKLYEESRELVY